MIYRIKRTLGSQPAKFSIVELLLGSIAWNSSVPLLTRNLIFFKVKESFTFKMDIFLNNKYIKLNLLGEQLLLSSSISTKLFFSEVVPELLLFL